MIKGSPDASLFAARDRIRAAARAQQPDGVRIVPDQQLQGQQLSARLAGPLGHLQGVQIGPYRLDVDEHGRVLALHEPTGTTEVLTHPNGTPGSED